MAGAQKLDCVSTKQQRIAKLAKQSPQLGFTSLNHHLDLPWLAEAYNRTRKNGAPGVDGQTADDYGLHLVANLTSLQDRAKSGTYLRPRCVACTSRKGPVLRPVPWGFPPRRTRSFSGRSSWLWSRFTNRTF